MLTQPCCIVDAAESRNQNPAEVLKIQNKFFSVQLVFSANGIPNVFLFFNREHTGEPKDHSLLQGQSEVSRTDKFALRSYECSCLGWAGSHYRKKKAGNLKAFNMNYMLDTVLEFDVNNRE